MNSGRNRDKTEAPLPTVNEDMKLVVPPPLAIAETLVLSLAKEVAYLIPEVDLSDDREVLEMYAKVRELRVAVDTAEGLEQMERHERMAAQSS